MWQEVELHTDSKQNMDLVSIGLSVSAGSINAKFPGFSLYFISNWFFTVQQFLGMVNMVKKEVINENTSEWNECLYRKEKPERW